MNYKGNSIEEGAYRENNIYHVKKEFSVKMYLVANCYVFPLTWRKKNTYNELLVLVLIKYG